MKSIGPVGLIADVRHDDRRHAGPHDGVCRSGATVMHDQGGSREQGPMVDGLDAHQVRRLGASLDRSLDHHPPTGFEQAIDGGAQLGRRDATHRPERDDDRRLAHIKERREPRWDGVRPRAVDPRPGDRRRGREIGRHADDGWGAGHDVQPRRASPEERQPSLRAAGPGEEIVERPSRPRESAVEHPPREPVRRPEARHAGRGCRRGRKEDRVEDGRRPGQPLVQHSGVSQRVDAVKQDEVVAAKQLAQPPEVRLAIGEMEVTQHGDLSHRALLRRFGGRRLDPSRIGVRSGHLDAHARPGKRRAVHRPRDRRHRMAAIDERAGEDRERTDVTGRADRGERDPHQIVAMRRGAMRGPYRGGVIRATSSRRCTRPRCPRYGSSSSSMRASSARGSPASAHATTLGRW